eukprot:m.82616 g.82616  ORF g.82616 m.82616 type:complete len:676 (+) comp14623_c0_seq3:2473-4500(+)
MKTQFRNLAVYGLPGNSGSAAALAMLDVLEALDLQPIQKHKQQRRRSDDDDGGDARKQVYDEEEAYHLFAQSQAKRAVYTTLRAQIGHSPTRLRLSGQQINHIATEIRNAWAAKRALKISVAGQTKQGDVHVPDLLPSEEGDTVSLAMADSFGQRISLLQSICQPFGSGIVSRRLGLVFQSRGAAFALDGPSNHPNLYGPGRRPFHTLTGFYVINHLSKARLAVAMKGGSRQPYAFVKLLLDMELKQLPVPRALQEPRYLHADIDSRSPWYPLAAVNNSAASNELFYDGHIAARIRRSLRAHGVVLKPASHKPVDRPFYDSLFGVAAIVSCTTADVCEGYADLRRKPGSAINLVFMSIKPPSNSAALINLDKPVKAWTGQPWTGPVCVLAAANPAWSNSLNAVGAIELKMFAGWNQPSAERKEKLLRSLASCKADAALVLITSNLKERAWFNSLLPGVINTAPSLHIMELLSIKDLFHHWMLLNGFEANLPKLYLNTHHIADEEFPVIVKSLSGTNSDGVYLVKSRRDLDSQLKQLVGGRYLIQEAVGGLEEYSCNFLARTGNITRCNVYAFAYDKEAHIKAGKHDGRLAKVKHACTDFAAGTRVAQRIALLAEYTGIGCLQWKEPRPGMVKVIEVNPRPCGSLIKDAMLTEWLRELVSFAPPITMSSLLHRTSR